MYQLLFSSVPTWIIALVAMVSMLFGQELRFESPMARRYCVPLGLTMLVLIIVEGSNSSGLRLEHFLGQEFFRLFWLSIALINFTAAFFREVEPFIVYARQQQKERKAERKRLKEEAKRERERKLANQRHEEARPANEALARKRQQLADENRAKEAAIAREKAAAEAVAREKTRLAAEQNEQARQRVLLAYFRASPKVQEAISWERLQEYMNTYLSNSKSTDLVKANAQRMVRTILSHASSNVRRMRKSRSVVEVVNEFKQKQLEIEKLQLSEDERSSLLADLEMQRSLEMEHCK